MQYYRTGAKETERNPVRKFLKKIQEEEVPIT